MSQLDNLNCGYCHALFIDHDVLALRICLYRLDATKRDLAEKVRNTVQLSMPPITAKYSDDDRSLTRTLTAVIAELDRLFTESGVEVERGVNNEPTTNVD